MKFIGRAIEQLDETHFIGSIAILAAIKLLLILGGALPPLSAENDISNIFNLLSIAILFGFGYALSGKSNVYTAIKGAFAMLVSIMIAIFAIFIGIAIGRPVLGVSTPDTFVLLLYLIILLITNVLIGAVVVVASAWMTNLILGKRKVKAIPSKKKKRSKR